MVVLNILDKRFRDTQTQRNQQWEQEKGRVFGRNVSRNDELTRKGTPVSKGEKVLRTISVSIHIKVEILSSLLLTLLYSTEM